MKYAVYGLLAAFLAQGVYGDIPTTASGWYTPSEWRTVKLDASYERNGVTYGCTINAAGEILWGDGRINDPLVEYSLETAVEAWWNTKRNNQKFEKLGEELHNLTSKDGIHIRNENTEQEFTIKFGGSLATAVSGSSGEIPAVSNAADPADNASLGWSDGKLQLKGWHLPDSSTSLWDYPYGAVAVRLSPNDNTGLHYFPWHGVDGLSLAPDESTHKLELSGWTTAEADVMTPLAEVLTKAEGDRDVFDDYELVVRNSGKGLNYVSLGTLDVDLDVDGLSIGTNASGQVELKNWHDATEMPDGLLCKTADGNLATCTLSGTNGIAVVDDATAHDTYVGLADWEGGNNCDDNLSALLTNRTAAASVARAEHKILARCDHNGETSLHYMPIGDALPMSGGAVDDATITTDTAHGAATQGVASIYGWADGSPSSTNNLNDILGGSADGDYSAVKLLARNPSGAVSYIPIGGAISISVVAGAGCYEYTSTGFANRYYRAGGVLYSGPSGGTAYTSCFVALQISASNPSSATIQSYDSFSAMQTASQNANYITLPLYSFDSDGEILCDFRTIPTAQMIEVLP